MLQKNSKSMPLPDKDERRNSSDSNNKTLMSGFYDMVSGFFGRKTEVEIKEPDEGDINTWEEGTPERKPTVLLSVQHNKFQQRKTENAQSTNLDANYSPFLKKQGSFRHSNKTLGSFEEAASFRALPFSVPDTTKVVKVNLGSVQALHKK